MGGLARSRACSCLAAVIVLGFFLVLWTGPLGRAGTVVIDDYLCAAVPLVAGGFCVRRSRLAAGRDRRGWLLLGCSSLSWGLGGTVWALYEVHLGVEVPYPSLADVGYLSSVPFAITGLVLLSGGRAGWVGGLRTVLDGALVAAALLFISWATVLGPIFRSGEGTLLAQAVSLAYPASDVLTATIALMALGRAQGQTRVVMTMIGIGVGVVAVSDSSFAWFTAQGSYASGNLFDTGYVAGYLLVALAALRPVAADADVPRTEDPDGTLSLTLPYVPVAGMAVFAMVSHVRGVGLDGLLFWDALLVFALVLARQLLSLRVNHALRCELQASLVALREREAALHHQAHHDALTGLANRTMFTDRVHQLLDQDEVVPVAVLLIDVDDFKSVNDTHGHQVGDLVLVEFARRLSAATRTRDCVARLGGDEFAILVPEATTVADGHAVAERIRAALQTPVTTEQLQVQVSASIGLAHSDDAPTLEALLRHADAAMYLTKRGRRRPDADVGNAAGGLAEAPGGLG